MPHRRLYLLAVLLAGAAALAGLAFTSVRAWPELFGLAGAGGIDVVYTPPTDPTHRPIYDRLIRRGVLEEYRQFMSPLQLPRKVTVATVSCDGKINAWYLNGKISYCYEYMAFMEAVAGRGEAVPGFRREDALVGAFVQVLLHETAHMVFAQFGIPVLGREEDAADQVASFILLNLGPTVARRALTGAAFFWRVLALRSNYAVEDFADEHGTHGQRFFNTLCLAYGSDVVAQSNTFSDFIERKLLPDARRPRCASEYAQAKRAFEKLIMPHVDAAMMRKVREHDWLRADDGRDAMPPAPSPGDAGAGGREPQ